MSQFKPYPAYKDSGVEWLGEVPEHWVDRKIVRDIPFVVSWTPLFWPNTNGHFNERQ